MTDITAVVSTSGTPVSGVVRAVSSQGIAATVGASSSVRATVASARQSISASVGTQAAVIAAVVVGAPPSAPQQDSWFGSW